MPVNIKAKLLKKEELTTGIFKFSVQAEEIVKTAKPGHFVEIRVNDDIEPFLRRPISIYNIDRENGILEFIFQEKGKGTKMLSARREGELIDIIGPLGHGTFKYSSFNNLAIIGGGIGVFPLYELAKSAKLENKNINTYLGFRNKDLVVLEDEFRNVSNNIIIATDDGSYAEKGFAIDFLKKDIPCQISLEEKMACGLGVCLGCAVKTAASPKDAPEYWHVCKAGPVFQAKDVEI